MGSEMCIRDSNDIDVQGKWIEWTFSGSGSRTVSMTAVDEGPGSTITLTVIISEAPFSLGDFMASYALIIVLMLIASVIGAVFVIRNRQSNIEPLDTQVDQTSRLKKVSVDDAFDDPEYDPFDDRSRKEGPKTGLDVSSDDLPEIQTEEGIESVSQETVIPDDVSRILLDEEESEAEGDLGEYNEGDLQEEVPESVALSLEDALDDEDIEALFEE